MVAALDHPGLERLVTQWQLAVTAGRLVPVLSSICLNNNVITYVVTHVCHPPHIVSLGP